jgi:predicted nucleotidyltransferase
MGTRHKTESVSSVLFGKTRRAVLGLLYAHPDEAFYHRQVMRRTGAGKGAVQRELKCLSDAAILTRAVRGREVYYQANRQCPVFTELRGLVLKTVGLADVLREYLAPLADRIDTAFVYGSQASGSATAMSDVDLAVVGDVDEMTLHKAVSRAEQRLSRPVNYTLISRREFQRRRKEKGGFLSRILRGPKVVLVSNVNEI